jgi:hypothetical protein
MLQQNAIMTISIIICIRTIIGISRNSRGMLRGLRTSLCDMDATAGPTTPQAAQAAQAAQPVLPQPAVTTGVAVMQAARAARAAPATLVLAQPAVTPGLAVRGVAASSPST